MYGFLAVASRLWGKTTCHRCNTRKRPPPLASSGVTVPADLELISCAMSKKLRTIDTKQRPSWQRTSDRYASGSSSKKDIGRLKRQRRHSVAQAGRSGKHDRRDAFLNMSRDENGDYFSDGLAEELLNVLSKIRGLRVAARTSAFSFKGKQATISESDGR